MVNIIYIESVVEGMEKAGCIMQWVQRKVIEERNFRNTWGMFEGEYLRIRETSMTGRMVGTWENNEWKGMGGLPCGFASHYLFL